MSLTERNVWESSVILLVLNCSFVIQVQCNIHWFASGSLLTREDDSWDTSCGRYAGTGRKPKTTSSHQSVNRRFERQWSRFEVSDLVIISTCVSLCSMCSTNVGLRSSFHRDGYAWFGSVEWRDQFLITSCCLEETRTDWILLHWL